MAKGQKRSNREIRKPKKEKADAKGPTALLERASPPTAAPPKKKKRRA